MHMDPVRMALEEIRAVERYLEELNNAPRSDRHGGESRHLLEIWLESLRAAFLDLEPTSVIGSAALIRAAVDNLPDNLMEMALPLEAIAARMEQGERRTVDVIWLRSAAASLPRRADVADIRQLLDNAIIGAAKPILIYRAAHEAVVSAA